MNELDEPDAGRGEPPHDGREELRTIGFRMREIQRLLAIRVQQENRRLEAEGLEPVEFNRLLDRQPDDR